MIELNINKALHSHQGPMPLDIALEIPKGSFTAIQGKSGAGKTSLLRTIAGLMTAESGKIRVNNELWFDDQSKINLSIQQRKVGYVFQDYALFPHLTVYQNLEFALAKRQSKTIVHELIELMELGQLQSKKPGLLSGGQKQRVALARALVQKPSLLLLDEPLSALDNEIRHKLQDHLLQVHREFGLTTLMVSHDNSEVLRLADHLIILEQGKLARQGNPSDLLANRQVSGKFQFTGEIIDIQQEGVVSIITILVGKELIKVISEKSESQKLSKGDKVLVASKAFNPIVQKLS